MMYLFFILILFAHTQCYAVIEKSGSCTSVLSARLISEIDNYQPIVNRIIDAALNGSFKGIAWNELATFVDEFGPRFTGTETLENAIDYVLDRSKKLGLENVHGEMAPVPHWIRYAISKSENLIPLKFSPPQRL